MDLDCFFSKLAGTWRGFSPRRQGEGVGDKLARLGAGYVTLDHSFAQVLSVVKCTISL